MNKKYLTIALVGLALALAGCAKRGASVTAADMERELQQKSEQVEKLEASVEGLEQDLQASRSEIQAKEQALAQARREAEQAREAKLGAEQEVRAEAAATQKTQPGFELLPPGAKAGECYARVFVPPTYRTETERVLKKEASERIEVMPAKYDSATEQVLVKEGSKRVEVVPAEYGWKEERVLVKPASKQLVEVPAKYDWVEEKVLVKPAHTVWKKGRGPIEKVDNATGEIMCLVEVPAVYETVKKRVLVKPAHTKEVEIPAEYKTVRRQVVLKPATTREVEIPAEYETVKVSKLVSPPEEKRITVPAEYKEVTKTVQADDGRMEWRRVLCETNMTHATIQKIQLALRDKGHDPGPIDGLYGPLTRRAVRSFQQARGLSTGGLTLKTIEALGVRM